MATEFTLYLEKQVLNEELVLEGVHNLGFTSTTETPSDGPRFECESCCDTLGFVVTLRKSSNPPNNVFDVDLLGREFVFRQSLNFWFDREIELSPSFEKALKMIFDVMSKVRMRAFLYTSSFEELCFFNEDKSLYLNKSSGMWKVVDVRKELSAWKVIEVTL